MAVEIKICGLSRPDDVEAAVAAGAAYLGFVLFPPSPRHIDPGDLPALAGPVQGRAGRVGVFVDPDDALLGEVAACLDYFQLHGEESPARIADIKRRFGKPVIKALKIAEAGDLAQMQAFDHIVDMVLFDARPPPGSSVPGGHGRPFDWTLLAAAAINRPWMLSGGLTAGNVAAAIAESRAPAVDVSSGVESRRGVKSVELITAFADSVRAGHHGGTMSREDHA